MGSVVSWTANSVLFAIGCLLAADTANKVIAAALLPTAPAVAAPRASAPPTPVRARSWAEREIILSRNLFHSSLAAPPVVAEDEELEKSKLPVTLLGTFAATDPDLSRATLMDKEKNETLVVGIGDQIKNTATVNRIERRRVVITENGAPRELTFGDEEGAQPTIQRARPTRRAAAAQSAIRQTQSGVAVSRDAIQKSMRDPSELLSQARVLPKFEQGQMVGLQVNGIKPGSLFQEIGLQEGDVITQFNGIAIDSPDQSAKIFQELANAAEFNVVVRGADGAETVKNFTPE
ncbi:MAG TPA: type II secretion system protein GspC [Myxococcota bacterium]|nr:type II secretion system protein GspC [Myxococcota bacterium]